MAIPGDKSAFNPSGIRLGTPALTTRGLVEKDIEKVVDFIDRGLKLGLEVAKKSGPKLVDYKKEMTENPVFSAKIQQLKQEVHEFSSQFPLPGLKDY
ncbi:Serine hydroxymethyltransferase, cytosolic [Frankliniella fusca]|uniref:Serine hydroxymethyltransferase, cytosolic n=1 Tax=Frankliniella fusca TaxID=407009 RepID=A0AAE1LF15_9NEOP|nr:Serine hydroxymethyltransferase, cytosolic [Frankliniella fusca]